MPPPNERTPKFFNTWSCWLVINRDTQRAYAAFQSGTDAEDWCNWLNNSLSQKIPFVIEVIPGMKRDSDA